VEALIEVPKVVRIGREHTRTMLASSDGNGGVTDVGGRRYSTELPCGSRLSVVKDQHVA
jgi:hypothetical protein